MYDFTRAGVRKVFLVCSFALLLILIAVTLRHGTSSNMGRYSPGHVPASNGSQKCFDLSSLDYKSWKLGMVTATKPRLAANCSKLVAGDKKEVEMVRNRTSRWKNAVSDKAMLKRVRNCSWLREYFTDNLYNSELEKYFPIAFTFVVYDSPQQVLRLLRLLYRPQNAYCIHYDAKTTSPIKEYAKAIAGCLDNVIVPSKLERVVWGHYSVLAAQMNCMTDLLKFRSHSGANRKWKYLLNLCGKELPLLTSKEMVQKFVKLNGSSSLRVLRPENTKRIQYLAKLSKDKLRMVVDKTVPLGPPPFNISQYYKSQSYVALSYQFTKYLTTNSRAIEIHSFFKKCKNPEEHFYATMFMMSGVPGGYDKALESDYFILENVFWMYSKDAECRGKIVHSICIVGVGDLPHIINGRRGHIFHNKYFMEYDHTVMRCMEERIVQRNKLEYQQDRNCSSVITNHG